DLIGEVPPCTISVKDKMDGGSVFNTMRFLNRTGPVKVDERLSGGEVVTDDSGVSKGPMVNFNEVIGTPFNDQLIGGPSADILVGGGGADVMCGGYGTDTVDYSDPAHANTGVNVSLDPNPAVPDDPRWNSTDVAEWGKAPHDCRQTNAQGAPVVDAAHPLNCVANDGSPGEGDCVGPDVENVIGTSHDDVLTGNSPG